MRYLSSYRRLLYKWIRHPRLRLFCLGLLMGLLLHFVIRNYVSKTCRITTLLRYDAKTSTYTSATSQNDFKRKKLIFAGIMTAEKFLDTRVKAVYDTWAKDLPGTVMFFSSANTTKRSDLPVVALKGVDDSYPPQRKSMMMLKYMYDNYGHEYEWFLRSDDDVYVRGERLGEFLRKFNSSKDLYIGQAGQGVPDEQGQLGLGGGDNFCMGGPSIIFSASTLRKVTPHVEYCLKHLASTHEDVEVGRCIKKFVGVPCTASIDMQTVLVNDVDKQKAFTGSLETDAVRNAITLHPLKNPAYMYRVHLHYKHQKIENVNFQRVQHQRRLRILDQLSSKGIENLNEIDLLALNDLKDFHQNLKKDEAPIWENLTPRKVYSALSNSPEIGMLNPTRDVLQKVQSEAMSLINQDVHKVLYRTLELKKFNHGYRRYHPLFGMQYRLDLILKYHRHIGKKERGMTVYVHHNSYLQLPFGTLMYSINTVSLQTTVHFILTLTGRLLQFKRFMENYERVVLKTKERAKLIVLFFPENTLSNEQFNLYQTYRARYSSASLEWINMQGRFIKALALNLGAAQYEKSALLFYIDVDFIFNTDSIHRCRANTILGKQVYFPIVFSQFNPELSPDVNAQTKYFSKDAGMWRYFGMGVVCQYRSDFDAIGGYNTSIIGWGIEDVEFYDRFAKSGKYTVLRAYDPSLIHIYHEKYCDPTLPANQMVMCVTSKSQIYASQKTAYEHVLAKNYLIE